MKKIIFLSAFIFSAGMLHAQNVGIGTINPSRAKLEVHGTVGSTSAIFGGESTGISLQRNWPGIGFNQYHNGANRYIGNGFAAVQFVDPGTGHMCFDMFNNGTANSIASTSRRAMIISNDGRVNIGSADYPPATLNVARGTAFDGTAVFQGTTHRSHFNFGTAEDTYIRAGKNNGTVFINDIPGAKTVFSGNVGINTSTPGYPLEIRQSDWRGLILVEPSTFDNWGIYTSESFGGTLNFNFNGVIKGYISNVDGSYNHLSDIRLKTNIKGLPVLLDKVMQLQPVEYEMIHNNPKNQKSIGFIAQKVKELFPELVSVSTDTVTGHKGITDLHAINYEGFGILAIKAIQEQQQQLNELKKEIAILKEANKSYVQLLNNKN